MTAGSFSIRIPERTKAPPGRRRRRSSGRQADVLLGQDVGQHQVETSLQGLEGPFGHLHPIGDAVQMGIFFADAAGFRIDVAGKDPLRAQGGRGDRQNPGTGSDVEHPLRRLAFFEEAGEGFQAEPGGAVGAGAEGHSGVDIDHHVPGAGPKTPPSSV